MSRAVANTFVGQGSDASARGYFPARTPRVTVPQNEGGGGRGVARGEIQVPSNPAQSHGNRQDAGGVNASHPAPTPDVESQTLSVVYERVLECHTIGDHSKMQLAVHDLGGQPEFYDLLNLMISRCCVYLVVFNLEDFALQGEGGRRAEQRCVSYLKFWLSCISERSARGSDATPAPVILVGTHADTVNNVSDGVLFVYLLSLTKYFIISAPAAATYF